MTLGLVMLAPTNWKQSINKNKNQNKESNNLDNFGFGDICPNTLEAEHQQEQEQESNDPDDFGFGDVSPNTLEAEHQQEQEHNTSTQQVLATPPKE